jgi:hypothetical protein
MRAHSWSRSLLTIALVATASLAASGCFGRHAFIAIGTAIDVLPGGFVTVSVANRPYYYHRGIFYRRYRRGYLVVPAPVGAMIMIPPPGVLVMVDNDPYRYYRGVFYRPRGDRYVVVRPPVGAFVRTLPRTAVTHRIDGVEFKEYAGTYYRRAIRDGDHGYQVTEPPTRR